jgi:hypothetical protein
MQEPNHEGNKAPMNYRLMDAWYQVSRSFLSTEAARRALEVVAHFANVMGERSACAAAA